MPNCDDVIQCWANRTMERLKDSRLITNVKSFKPASAHSLNRIRRPALLLLKQLNNPLTKITTYQV